PSQVRSTQLSDRDVLVREFPEPEMTRGVASAPRQSNQRPAGEDSSEHQKKEEEPDGAAGAPSVRSSHPLKAIQLYDAYLVLETEEGMLVIDQHALHERILFEQLKERIRAGTLETQRLLIPEPIEFTPEQAARTLEQRESLAELGLGVEDFGGGTLLLTSYPAILGARSPQVILRAVVDHLVA